MSLKTELQQAEAEVERLTVEHREAQRKVGMAYRRRAQARQDYQHSVELEAQGDIDRWEVKADRLERDRDEARAEVARIQRRIADAREWMAADHGDRDPRQWGDVAATVGKVMPSIAAALPPWSEVQNYARRLAAWAQDVERTARRLEAVRSELAVLDDEEADDGPGSIGA